jgi:outer membrane protein assembly factor BamB
MESEETRVYTPVDTPRRRRTQAMRLREDQDGDYAERASPPDAPSSPYAREMKSRGASAAASRRAESARRSDSQYPPPVGAKRRTAPPEDDFEGGREDAYERAPQRQRAEPSASARSQPRPDSAGGASPPKPLRRRDPNAYYGRNAQAQGQDHRQRYEADPDPIRDESPDTRPDRGRRNHGCLTTILILLLIITIGIGVVWFFMPEWKAKGLDFITNDVMGYVNRLINPDEKKTDKPVTTPIMEPEDEGVSVLDLFIDSPDMSDLDIPVQFTLRTKTAATRVRLLDQNGEEIAVQAGDGLEHDDARTWNMSVKFDAVYEGVIRAQAGDANAWSDTGIQSVNVRVGVPLASPTPIPTLEPTPTPEPTASPEPTLTPEPTPSPTPTPNPFRLQPAVGSRVSAPELSVTKTSVLIEGQAVPTYSRSKSVVMGAPEDYNKKDGRTVLRGVSTFRGGPFRQNAAYGNVDIKENALTVLWEHSIGSLGNFTGVGWTGQAAIVTWPSDIREMMNIVEDKKAKTALKEVIYATLDGNVYFYDLEDGEETRSPIKVGYPIKGSATIHPTGYPFMLIGQGISILGYVQHPIGERGFNLIDQSEQFLINGVDKNATLTNGTFNGTALIDPATNTMITAGGNGLFYTTDLGLRLDAAAGALSTTLSTVNYYYEADDKLVGTESSVAVYGQYAYYGDNGGRVQCVDISTMQPVWIADTGDKVAATVALEVETDGRVALYTGNTVVQRKRDSDVTIRRLNALTGDEEWAYTIRCDYSETITGGCMASPVVGKGALEGLVFFTVSRTSDGGTLLALDKQTGQLKWRASLGAYSWSSPVAVYNESGRGWIIQGNSKGKLSIFDGLTGSEMGSVTLNGNIEASPAVYGDILVVGTKEQKIYGIQIK